MRIAEAGLEELAFRSLHRLRKQLDTIVDAEDSFNPRHVVENPANLLQSVKQFQKYLRVKDRTPIYFRRMLALGPVLNICCMLLIGFGSVVLASWAGINIVGYEEIQATAHRFSLVGFLIVILVSAIAFLIYVFAVHSISSAEILSKKLQDD